MILTQWIAGLTAAVLAVALALGAIHNPATPDAPPPEKSADEKIEDGVYVLQFEGEGRKVKLSDGSDAILGKRLSQSIGTDARLESVTNDNTRYNFYVNKIGPLPPEVTNVQTALVVDGVVLHLGRPEKLPADGIVNTWANVYSADTARRLAANYKIEPRLRKHPGHRYEVRWTPDKLQYETGEPVKLKMELKNTGTGLLRFTFGGQQRGPRNNQFRFIAQEGSDGKGLPDTGDPTNFGGLMQGVTLKPGEVFTAEVDLSKWFTFDKANTYRITGVFEMPVIDPASEEGFRPVVWDDLAVAECVIRVVAKK